MDIFHHLLAQQQQLQILPFLRSWSDCFFFFRCFFRCVSFKADFLKYLQPNVYWSQILNINFAKYRNNTVTSINVNASLSSFGNSWPYYFGNSIAYSLGSQTLELDCLDFNSDATNSLLWNLNKPLKSLSLSSLICIKGIQLLVLQSLYKDYMN